PQTVAAGSDAVLSSTVTDNGPAGNPLTFTDSVPAGLTIDTVDTAAGTCAITGQQVSCTLTGLTSGKSATVDVIVTPSAGSFTNSVSVSQPSAATDPTTTNNTATASLTANTVTVAACHVTTLAKLPLGTAKTLLKTLGCKTGKVTKAYSNSVAKGDVIKTTPGKGTYAAAKSIAISESKGRKPKKKHHVLRH
ncbi:MAG TPA: PASTA domain-containing protein, partial [Solirubrobacteraceae bacterium]